MHIVADNHIEIERIARGFEEVFRARATTCAQAVDETAGIIRGHLLSWRDNLCREMEQELAALSVGCPPSFIRIAGQSHLEKPFNRLLAWLVDPDEDHGWGATFLRLLSHRIGFRELEDDLDEMASESRHQIEIRAERDLDGDDSGKEPDLAIRTPRAALLLENKVWAPESGDQYAPYLDIFHRWAGPNRKTCAVLCARSLREIPKGWNGFLSHCDLAELLRDMSKDGTSVPIWGRVCAALCASALMESIDHEKVRVARQLLRETKNSPVNTDQINRLRDLLPLPKPIIPWKETNRE